MIINYIHDKTTQPPLPRMSYGIHTKHNNNKAHQSSSLGAERLTNNYKMTRQNMILSPQDQAIFNNTTHYPRCRAAQQHTTQESSRRHITGKFRSALCHKCNSNSHTSHRHFPQLQMLWHPSIHQRLGKFKHWKLNTISQTKENTSLTGKISQINKGAFPKVINTGCRYSIPYQKGNQKCHRCHLS